MLMHVWFDSAEEAVNEVKRQAMDEVQKAVTEAEQKAFEMITAERAKMEKTLTEAKRKATEDAIQVINEQEDSSEVSVTLNTHSFSHQCADTAMHHEYFNWVILFWLPFYANEAHYNANIRLIESTFGYFKI